uniref:Arsenite methyltransferase n=1 Tax=Neobodo designis TaxID=312471 RepID=A0A7S1QQU5_NEODS|eukprot:CAMPEP_0174835338 /NCGR_PEP_ID=MMETSP1114-20130205/5355_1 /TAXON_ID=312471 /ORGANISM="Neobodo designis, Strain CCAP 1951/1" /LENGTH=378 /DNA_ID=CAMNT_0016069285 /DNA_START=27 /DNA_END=1166 /DNA_ORIENTATION=+
MSTSVSGTTQAKTAGYSNKEEVLASVREYYGEVLGSTEDLRTSACTACGAPPPAVRAALKMLPKEVVAKFYGCGNPVPPGIRGLSILDLGSGSGRDCYVASLFAGKEGKVIGIDMTDEQIATARGNTAAFHAEHPDTAPLDFRKGFIEDIAGAGVADGSVDMIISNCVINLSPNKELVLRGAYNALRAGGEMYFSDVYVDRRVSDEARRHKLLLGECLSGALYTRDFLHMCRQIGFEVRRVSDAPIAVHDAELADVLGNARFTSTTYRCFKLDAAARDEEAEDYGQTATYLGTLPDAKHGYALDEATVFETNRPLLVSGNTAEILSTSWLAKHFRVTGDRSTHFGAFGEGAYVAPQKGTTFGKAPACGEGEGGCCESS